MYQNIKRARDIEVDHWIFVTNPSNNVLMAHQVKRVQHIDNGMLIELWIEDSLGIRKSFVFLPNDFILAV